jgi:hypothetical protein
MFCTHFIRITNLTMTALSLSDNQEPCDNHTHSFQQAGQFQKWTLDKPEFTLNVPLDHKMKLTNFRLNFPGKNYVLWSGKYGIYQYLIYFQFNIWWDITILVKLCLRNMHTRIYCLNIKQKKKIKLFIDIMKMLRSSYFQNNPFLIHNCKKKLKSTNIIIFNSMFCKDIWKLLNYPQVA